MENFLKIVEEAGSFNRDLRVTQYMPRYLEMIDFDYTFIRLVKNFEWKLTFKLFSFAV